MILNPSRTMRPLSSRSHFLSPKLPPRSQFALRARQPQRTITSSPLRPTRPSLYLSSTTTAPITPLPSALRPQSRSASTSAPASSSPVPSSPSTSPAASGPQPPDHLDAKELEIFQLLQKELRPTKLEVQDISGGCGSMYALNVTSEAFRGLPTIKQHRLVNKALGELVKGWHGVQVRTALP